MKNSAPQIGDTEAWSDEHRNPDKWLRIPNFEVIPAPGLHFQGYLAGQHARFPDLDLTAKGLVRASRKLLRQSFSDMDEVRTEWGKALDLFDEMATADPDPFWSAPKRMRAATFYNLMIDSLELYYRATKRTAATMHILEAVQSFAAWVADDGSLPTSERMRQLQARRKLKGSPEALAALAANLGFPGRVTQKDFVLTATANFGVTERQVQRWLAAAREKNLMT